MKEYPITFTAAEVLAILDGRKTQFRRVVKWPLLSKSDGSKRRMLVEKDAGLLSEILKENTRSHPHLQLCPYGQPGDRLWVRETWARNSGTAGGCLYKCDYGNAKSLHTRCLKTGKWIHEVNRWQSPVTMPRKASRIWLEIQSVRVERLQDITRGDAMAEGCPFSNMQDGPNPRAWFATQWVQSPLHENPWVWVVTFRVVEGGLND